MLFPKKNDYTSRNAIIREMAKGEKMKTLITILIVGMIWMDYKCHRECTQDGYMWGYCNRICSY